MAKDKPKPVKARRCASCRKWVKPDIQAMCQAWWLCYHCGGPSPFEKPAS